RLTCSEGELTGLRLGGAGLRLEQVAAEFLLKPVLDSRGEEAAGGEAEGCDAEDGAGDRPSLGREAADGVGEAGQEVAARLLARVAAPPATSPSSLPSWPTWSPACWAAFRSSSI
ncbi:hypothetical protein GS884_08920, partial [Rhodococcus hoagii]|nr:hypothetical protein [Prescottella equi]